MGFELPPEHQRQLDAAEGWLGLGDHLSANDELEALPAAFRAHPKALLLRYEIYSRTGKWEACVDLAGAVVQSAPAFPDGWVKRSYALHELKRTQEALDLLLPVAERFEEQWVIPYNLACYCSCLGRLTEAEKWLARSFDIGKDEAKLSAIDDPDLEPIWKSRENATWKLGNNLSNPQD